MGGGEGRGRTGEYGNILGKNTSHRADIYVGNPPITDSVLFI